MSGSPKRLIEVDLPIKKISAQARREKSNRRGHIPTLHIWGARRPLAACRAVLCAALWPDPRGPLSAEEGGGHLVEYPDIPGCMSDGETIADAIANGREALRDCLEVFRESGRKPIKPRH